MICRRLIAEGRIKRRGNGTIASPFAYAPKRAILPLSNGLVGIFHGLDLLLLGHRRRLPTPLVLTYLRFWEEGYATARVHRALGGAARGRLRHVHSSRKCRRSAFWWLGLPVLNNSGGCFEM